MKNILIISSSYRAGGNSETLAAEFAKGAEYAGHRVEMISLRDKAIGHCRGCLACQATKRCVIRDDANAITDKMIGADVIVFATPIYFFEMSGRMKTLIDRTNPLYSAAYAFRDVYLLATAAGTDEIAMDGAVKGLQGWIECFAEAGLMGVVRATGVTDAGDIQGSPALIRAYEMGTAV